MLILQPANKPRGQGMNTKDFIQQQWVKDELIRRLDYNPETGALTWKPRGQPWFDKDFAGKPVGQRWIDKTGYKNSKAKLIVKGKTFSVGIPRLCWLIHTGDWPKNTIDHINRDSWDNRWENLRDVSQKKNNFNKGFYKKRVFKHISRAGSSWVIRFDGQYFGREVCLGKAIKKRDKLLVDRGLSLTPIGESVIKGPPEARCDSTERNDEQREERRDDENNHYHLCIRRRHQPDHCPPE
jgi:hypothetical protein